MLHSWCDDAVTVKRAPLATTGMRTERDWSQAASHTVSGCSLQPAGTSTAFGTVDAVAGADAILYAPPASDIQEGDRIEFGGAVYVVDGIPYAWKSPTGRTSHVQARLSKWEG